MDCKKCRDLMNQYMDHTLSVEQERELLLHTESCEQCRVDFEVYRSMRAVFDKPAEFRLPDGFEDRVYQKIDAYEKSTQKARKPFYLRKYAMGSMAACLVAGLFLSSYFYSGIQPGFDQQQIDNPPIAIASAVPEIQPAEEQDLAAIPTAAPTVTPEAKVDKVAPRSVSTPRPTVAPTEAPIIVQTPPPANETDSTKDEQLDLNQMIVSTPTPSPVENSTSVVKPFAMSALASTRIQVSKDVDLKSLLTKNGISYTESNDKIMVESASYDKIEQMLLDNDIEYTTLDDVGSNANLIVFVIES